MFDAWRTMGLAAASTVSASSEQSPSVDPSDAVNQVAITAHSVILELRNSPVREFNIQSYGLVEGLGERCPAPVPPRPSARPMLYPR